MQLSQRIRARDLEEFFSSVGKVRDVRLITCNKTKRFKGIAYIEFKDPESVPLVSQHFSSVPLASFLKYNANTCILFAIVLGIGIVWPETAGRTDLRAAYTSRKKSYC